FAGRGCGGSLAGCGAFAVLGDAAAQCLHEIDHPVRRGKGLPALWNGAGLLGLQMRQQCLLVAVPEGRRIKLAGLAVENMLGQREHVRRNGEGGQVAEVILRLAHLIGVAQRGAEQPLVIWLKRITRSRLESTSRPSATIRLPRMASRITAKASCPTGALGMT